MADLMEIGVVFTSKGEKQIVRDINNVKNATNAAVDSTKDYVRQNNQSATSLNNASNANHIASRRTNAYGMAMQQAGYQIGDFIVQVQGGTNAFVAFGQQATQLVGVLPMLAGQFNMNVTRLIAISSVLGVVIPLATAFGAALMRSREVSDKTEKSISNLSDAISEYESSVSLLRMSQSDLNKEFGSFSGYAVQAARALKQIALSEINKEVVALADTFTDVSDLMGEKIPSNVNKTVRDFLGLNEGIRKNNEIVADFLNAQIKVSEAKGPEEQAQALNNLIALYESIIGSEEQRTEEQQNYLNLLVQALSKLSEFGAESERVSALQDDILGSVEGLAAANEALNEQEQKRLDAQKEFQDRLDQTRQTMGKVGSETVVVTDSIIKTAMAMGGTVEDAIRLQEALDSGKISAINLAGVDINNAITPAVRSARKLAEQLGISFRLAAAMSGAIVRGADSEALDPRSPRYDPEVAKAARIKEIMESGDLYKDFPTTSTRGGGAGVDPTEEFRKAKDAVDQLRASYDEQFATQMKVADAQRKVNELIAINPKLTDSANQILQDYIASLEDADDTMSQFVNDAASQMSDAFMSIVDGSKSASDAFEDMGRAILKQAFELAVINPLINSLFGGISGFNKLPVLFANANGNAFNNGNVIPFANGGVVSGPTMFPMRGNQTGLMGEAGPEAIMPLKRTKGGKLGVVAEGGGNVTIHQSFNFSANGDDSVKKIIAAEAPKIANLTQKQIMDQRRRGGAMKSTFG